MRKIGILGGTFDPIHIVHIEIALEAGRQYHLDEVILMPAKYPPHKLSKKIASDEDRLNMTRLACAEHQGISVSDLELRFNKISFTADTLTYLSEKYQEAELYFIMGGDSVLYLEKWNRPDIIFEKAKILYARRNGVKKDEIENHIRNVIKRLYPKAELFEVVFPETSVSSSNIREEVGKGNFYSIKKDLSPLVFQYMIEKKLYQQ